MMQKIGAFIGQLIALSLLGAMCIGSLGLLALAIKFLFGVLS
jgi:hypothetical protein